MEIKVKLNSYLRLNRKGYDYKTGLSYESDEPVTVIDVLKALDIPTGDVQTVYLNGKMAPLTQLAFPGDEINVFPGTPSGG